jgi:hypothetical protein
MSKWRHRCATFATVSVSWLAVCLLSANTLSAQAMPPILAPVPPALSTLWAVTPTVWGQTAPRAGVAASAEIRFSFTPSIEARQRTIERFLQETATRDAAAATRLRPLLDGGSFIAGIATSLEPSGLRVDNLIDAYAAYWVAAWHAVRGTTRVADITQMNAVRDQVAAGMLQSRQLLAASSEQKQAAADVLLVHAALIGVSVDMARRDPAQRRALAAAIQRGALTFGLNLDAMTLTTAGFVATAVPTYATAASPPRTAAPTSASAAPAIASAAPESVRGASAPPRAENAPMTVAAPPRTATGAGGPMPPEDQPLHAVLASVPAANRPVYAEVTSSSSFVGYPPVSVFRTATRIFFGTGYATYCLDFDPSLLSPTPESLGKARPDCELHRWRRKANGDVEIESGDKTEWYAAETKDPTILPFAPGQRLNISFGNRSGISFGTTASTMNASELRMSAAGEIAIGEWSTTVVSAPNYAGSSAAQSTPLQGRYRLDGFLLAIQAPGRAPTVGFAVGVGTRPAISFVFVNGKQFSKPTE